MITVKRLLVVLAESLSYRGSEPAQNHPANGNTLIRGKTDGTAALG